MYQERKDFASVVHQEEVAPQPEIMCACLLPNVPSELVLNEEVHSGKSLGVCQLTESSNPSFLCWLVVTLLQRYKYSPIVHTMSIYKAFYNLQGTVSNFSLLIVPNSRLVLFFSINKLGNASCTGVELSRICSRRPSGYNCKTVPRTSILSSVADILFQQIAQYSGLRSIGVHRLLQAVSRPCQG